MLLKNRQLPSNIEGIAHKLFLLYTGPYAVTAVKGPNTYQISDKLTKKKKGVYNYTEIKYITHQKTKR